MISAPPQTSQLTGTSGIYYEDCPQPVQDGIPVVIDWSKATSQVQCLDPSPLVQGGRAKGFQCVVVDNSTSIFPVMVMDAAGKEFCVPGGSTAVLPAAYQGGGKYYVSVNLYNSLPALSQVNNVAYVLTDLYGFETTNPLIATTAVTFLNYRIPLGIWKGRTPIGIINAGSPPLTATSLRPKDGVLKYIAHYSGTGTAGASNGLSYEPPTPWDQGPLFAVSDVHIKSVWGTLTFNSAATANSSAVIQFYNGFNRLDQGSSTGAMWAVTLSTGIQSSFDLPAKKIGMVLNDVSRQAASGEPAATYPPSWYVKDISGGGLPNMVVDFFAELEIIL